jgi:serine/threonine protein kinase
MSCPYQPISELGRGTFGNVYLVKQNNQDYALKSVVYKNKIDNPQEIDIMRKINHPNIIPIYSLTTHEQCNYLVNKNGLGLVLPLAQGDLIKIYKNLQFPQRIKMIYQLCCAVKFLHDNNILHLDIKPENFLVFNDNAVLSDFGLSISVVDIRLGKNIKRVYGTPIFVAPEVLPNGGIYNDKVDVWALGLSILNIMTGITVINLNTIDEIVEFINNNFGNNEQRTILKYIDDIPEEYVSGLYLLLSGMLKIDPDQRYDMNEVVNSLFFKQFNYLSCPEGTIQQPLINNNILSETQLESLKKGIIYLKRFPLLPLSGFFIGIDLMARNIVTLLSSNTDVVARVCCDLVLSMYRLKFKNDYGESLVNYQINIIINSGGILHRKYIFDNARSIEQLNNFKDYMYENLQLYLLFDVNNLFNNLVQPLNYNIPSKEILLRNSVFYQ